MACPSFRVQSSLVEHGGLLDRGYTRWLSARAKIGYCAVGNMNAPATLEDLYRPGGDCRMNHVPHDCNDPQWRWGQAQRKSW
ncbi:hypothetical protein N7447_007722 [Penicillium robsamsonii]|uniref:uncharacterized protein n=1 Tax=Penicillium robsamsonii TaxID=1792511 RepID=UPI0025480FE1|nr:uncharacterized protein N7447_007722 [Penicillium robsamsonii]KAJ5817714.1 hypothetical protein N7447_007722 [Penicillium robsamsonii]